MENNNDGFEKKIYFLLIQASMLGIKHSADCGYEEGIVAKIASLKGRACAIPWKRQ